MKKVLHMFKNWAMKLMGVPTCEEIEQFAYDYLESQLETKRLNKFERHLRGCLKCKRFVDSYREVARPEGLVAPISMDPEFESRVIDFLTKERDAGQDCG